MLQIDCFVFLITGFYNFQLITHDKPTKNIQCHSNYFSLLEVLDVPESSVLPSLITDIAKYMALGLPGKLRVAKKEHMPVFLKVLPDNVSDVRLKQHGSLNNIALMKIFSYLFLSTKA